MSCEHEYETERVVGLWQARDTVLFSSVSAMSRQDRPSTLSSISLVLMEPSRYADPLCVMSRTTGKLAPSCGSFSKKRPTPAYGRWPVQVPSRGRAGGQAGGRAILLTI
jgi:hypothetical protein